LAFHDQLPISRPRVADKRFNILDLDGHNLLKNNPEKKNMSDI